MKRFPLNRLMEISHANGQSSAGVGCTHFEMERNECTLPRIFGPKGGSHSKARLRPSSRLGSSFSWCAPAASTNPEVYMEHYAARAAACRHRHLSHGQPSRTTAYSMTPWCPFWSPFTPHGSIPGWSFYCCDPPILGVCI